MQPLQDSRIRRGGVKVSNAFTADREKTVEEWTVVDNTKDPPKVTKFTYQIKDIEEALSEEEE